MRGCSHVCMIGTLIINYRVCVCVRAGKVLILLDNAREVIQKIS